MFHFVTPGDLVALSAGEAHALAEAGRIALVDVREPAEWAVERIAGAIHAPLSDLADGAGRLPVDRPVVFYCLAGGRSARAVALCRWMGFPFDRMVAGGLSAWKAAGLPTVA